MLVCRKDMNEYTDYQFYTPGQEPTPQKPWWQERRTWVALGILLGLSLLVTVAILLVSNILRNRPAGDVVQDGGGSLRDQIAVQCENEDQACFDRAWAEAAQSRQEAELCAELSTEDGQANCATLVAKETGDVGDCEVVQGEARQECQDEANLFLAESATSFELCVSITDPELQASCSGRIWAQALASGDCAAYGLPSEACDSSRALEEAQNSGDPAECAALPEVDQAECMNSIETADEDLDGLVSKDEFEHNTNPNDPDTDDDGFSDGVEVQNGYDPLT